MSSLLIDTHVLLWALSDPDRLSPSAFDVLRTRATPAHLSAASVWEIAIKRRSGKLTAPDELFEKIGEAGFEPLPISAEHAQRAGDLPLHHRDPFDRMLVAQALHQGLTILTSDEKITLYDVPTLW